MLVRIDAHLGAGEIDQREQAHVALGPVVALDGDAADGVRARGRIVHARRGRGAQRRRELEQPDEPRGRRDLHLDAWNDLRLASVVREELCGGAAVEDVASAALRELGVRAGDHVARGHVDRRE